MNESKLELTEVQQRAIRAMAKADVRPAKQMLSMILKEGFYWTFSPHGDNPCPYEGWPKEWDKIQEELDKEFREFTNLFNEDN